MIQLACSRLVQVLHDTEKCTVQFRIWPVDDSNKKLLVVYLFYIVFGASVVLYTCYPLYGVAIINTSGHRFRISKKNWSVSKSLFI